MARIYTKGGDKGETSLVGGQRVSKTHAQIEAYGTIDELNTVIGLCRAACAGSKDRWFDALDRDLEFLQHWLFDLGSLLAATPDDRARFNLRPLTAGHVTWLEGRIDDMTARLQPLKNFILPAGCPVACHLHQARTVARRAERCMLTPGEAESLPDQAVPFINRLSDYLFVAARYANHLAGLPDVPWKAVDPA